MHWWQAALWGAVGGLSLDCLEITKAIRRVGGPPWKIEGEVSLGMLVFSVVLRTGAAVVLVLALFLSGDICNPIGGLVSGAAAPLILYEKIGSIIKGSSSKDEPEVPPTGHDAVMAGDVGPGDSSRGLDN
jgi:hypothetical protein